MAVFGVGLQSGFGATLGGSTYIKRGRGEGASHPSQPHHPRLPRPAPKSPPLPNPSYSLLLILPRCLRRSAAGDLHHHRHHAVMLAGFRGGSTTSAACWNGENDIIINTIRVTECGGAARLWHVKIFYSLLQAASDRLHQPRDPISLNT